jgi:hypothetical protein
MKERLRTAGQLVFVALGLFYFVAVLFPASRPGYTEYNAPQAAMIRPPATQADVQVVVRRFPDEASCEHAAVQEQAMMNRSDFTAYCRYTPDRRVGIWWLWLPWDK